MRAFCIFDDFPADCIELIQKEGIELKTVENGKTRPTEMEMKQILEEYDIVIIGTSQKIHEWMWENISNPKIVATASIGIDHIKVPENKNHLLTILNTPTVNVQSVAEYIVGAILMTKKRFFEGNCLYAKGENNKNLIRKPEDVSGSVIGLIGAGRISKRIMELLCPFGVQFLCYTKNPSHHTDLTKKFGVEFVPLKRVAADADIISVNIPSDASTEGLIHEGIIDLMKKDCIFISVSRAQVVDNKALLNKAQNNSDFYVVLDLDVMSQFVGKSNGRNIVITPHIAGGTIEARQRMFRDITQKLIECI